MPRTEWKEKVKVAQSCLTLCNPMDYRVHGILQARILEWVAFPFSRGSSQPRDWTQVSCIAGGFSTSWATREPLRLNNRRQRSPVVKRQAPLSTAPASTHLYHHTLHDSGQSTQLLCVSVFSFIKWNNISRAVMRIKYDVYIIKLLSMVLET